MEQKGAGMTYNTQLALACVCSVVIGVILAATLESAWTERNAAITAWKEAN